MNIADKNDELLAEKRTIIPPGNNFILRQFQTDVAVTGKQVWRVLESCK